MVKLSLSRGGYLFLISIYRLQYESITTFMTEFTELLNLHVICNKYNFVIAGDINIHVETEKTYANQFKNILSLYDLKQHVTEATHIKGHTIDVVITPNIDSYVQDLNITQLDLSHHSLIDFNLKTETKTKSEKTISFRSFKNIDTPQFRSEVQEKLIDLPQTNNIQSRVESYNATLTELVEKHAPVKTKVIKVVNEAPWFDVEYSNLRKLRRNAEKKYHKTHLEEDRMSYINLRKQTINLSFEKKKMYISNKLKNSNSSKALYTIVNELIDKKKQVVLPTNKSDEVLANKFQIFFIEKIEKIRSSFKPTTEKVVEYKHNENINLLSNFEPTTADEIKEIITSFGVKCSPEDPVPAELLSSNVDIFIPFWLEIVNLSLEMGSMDGLKSAVVLPLIKDISDKVDSDEFKNYRPVSNLLFISKIVERVVERRLDQHMISNNLVQDKNYAYKKDHSPELLLLKECDDLYKAFDKNIPSIVVLLDLSAAFDTVDHTKLLEILEKEIV